MHKALLTGLIVFSAITQVALSDQARATPLIADLRGGTDGSCNGSAFFSPSGQFSSGDIGKVLVVSGDASGTAPAAAAAIDNAPLFTTVVAVSSTTAITLSAACASTMTGITSAQWHLGTNNTVALQDCLDTGLCSVPAGIYLMSGPAPATPPNSTVSPYDSRVYPPSGSKLLCQPGAVFLFPHHDYYNNINRSLLDLLTGQ